jgi:hypothetical protein
MCQRSNATNVLRFRSAHVDSCKVKPIEGDSTSSGDPAELRDVRFDFSLEYLRERAPLKAS